MGTFVSRQGSTLQIIICVQLRSENLALLWLVSRATRVVVEAHLRRATAMVFDFSGSDDKPSEPTSGLLSLALAQTHCTRYT